MTSKQDELRHLICCQRREVPDIGLYGKLNFEDLKRVDKSISGDITNSKDCCLYNGTVVGENYSTFSYKGKKTSLIRILYHNLVADNKPDMKVKWSCENKGLCCNLSHFDMVSKETPKIEEISECVRDFDAKEENDENIFKFDDD